jgi:hypothetical protein
LCSPHTLFGEPSQAELHEADGRALHRASDSSISIQGTSAYLTVVVERGGERWSLDLAAPRGEALHLRSYFDAERASFRTGRAPGLDVSGSGRGCNEGWGTFSIRQISTDSSGGVTMLEATFVPTDLSADI